MQSAESPPKQFSSKSGPISWCFVMGSITLHYITLHYITLHYMYIYVHFLSEEYICTCRLEMLSGRQLRHSPDADKRTTSADNLSSEICPTKYLADFLSARPAVEVCSRHYAPDILTADSSRCVGSVIKSDVGGSTSKIVGWSGR